MTNLLTETLATLADASATPDDVSYVGSRDGAFQIEWSAFAAIADVLYDAGFGAAEVATDLQVVLKDGRYLTREEYDGSEWWVVVTAAPARNHAAATFDRVVGGCWSSLASINGQDEED